MLWGPIAFAQPAESLEPKVTATTLGKHHDGVAARAGLTRGDGYPRSDRRRKSLTRTSRNQKGRLKIWRTDESGGPRQARVSTLRQFRQGPNLHRYGRYNAISMQVNRRAPRDRVAAGATVQRTPALRWCCQAIKAAATISETRSLRAWRSLVLLPMN